jgi:hypothetical protein
MWPILIAQTFGIVGYLTLPTNKAFKTFGLFRRLIQTLFGLLVFFICTIYLKLCSKFLFIYHLKTNCYIWRLYFYFEFYHQFNLVRWSVLTSSGFSPLQIAVAGDRVVILPTKFNANYH